MPTNGLVTMTPTSVSVNIGTATINSNGSVTISGVATLSLNGVFTSSYENYMIVMRHSSNGDGRIDLRLRASGTDNSGTSTYVSQLMAFYGTSKDQARYTTNLGYCADYNSTRFQGLNLYLFAPQLAEMTAWRSVPIDSTSDGSVFQYSGTHSVESSYDGISLICSNGSITGLLTVFGFNQ